MRAKPRPSRRLCFFLFGPLQPGGGAAEQEGGEIHHHHGGAHRRGEEVGPREPDAEAHHGEEPGADDHAPEAL